MSQDEYPDAARVGVGGVVIQNDRVLLVKRSRPPAEGEWAIPGGRVRLGETLKQAAERELKEETGVIVLAAQPVYAFDVIERDDSGAIRFHYVVVDLLAHYMSGVPAPGDDAAEVRWVAADELSRLPVNKTTMRLLRTLIPRAAP